MADNDLRIVIQAEDQASATFNSVGASMEGLSAKGQALIPVDRSLNEDFAQFTATLEAEEVAAAGATVATAELGAVAEEAGAEAEASGGMFETLTTKADSMLERLAVKATVIAAVIGSFMFLKDAMKESEDANKEYTDQFEKSTDALARQKVAIGDEFLPALMLLTQTWADVTGANEDATHKTDDFGRTITNVAQFVAGAIVGFKNLGTELGDMASTGVMAAIDAFQNLGKEIGHIGQAFSDVIKGDYAKAWDDLKNTSDISWGNLKAAQNVNIEDAKKGAAEYAKVWAFKDPDELSQTPFVKAKKGVDQLKVVRDALDAYTDDLKKSAAEIQKDNEESLAKSAEDYDAYTTKVKSLRVQLTDLELSEIEKVANVRSSAHAKEVGEFETYSDELTKLKKKEIDLMLKLSTGKDENATADTATLKTTRDRMALVQGIVDKHGDLAADALKLKNEDKIQKTADAAAEEIATDERKYAQQQARLEASIVAEQKKYDDQKIALVKKVDDQYEAIALATEKGLEKVEKVKGITKPELAAAAAGAEAILGGINKATASSVLNIQAPGSAPAAAPITINIMPGATVHAMDKKNVDALAMTIKEALAQTMQTQRVGLSTH